MTCRTNLNPQLVPLAILRESGGGRRYWRSLEELADTDEFRRLIEREFPSQLDVAFDPVTRRKFLTLMGASLALSGIGGCSVKPAPVSEIVPYVRAPRDDVPGKPLFYATAMTVDGGAVGLLVETHQGRPTKIEGNPDHPASRGATSAQHQAAVLELYDPDRSQSVRYLGQVRTWPDAAATIRPMVANQREKRGAGLRILTEAVVSPTLQAQLETLLKQLPEAKWHVYEPINCDSAYQVAQWAFGKTVVPRYDFTKAERVVSFDADFLDRGPAFLHYAADFMRRRRAPLDGELAGSREMNQLYVVETAVSCTGAKADHRLAVRGREIELLARALAAELKIEGVSGVDAAIRDKYQKWLAAVARELQSHSGKSLLLAGDRQPPVVHLLAHVMNDRLKNVGSTIEFTAPVEARAENRIESLTKLTESLDRGEVECLVILSANVAFTAPADIPFVKAMEKAALRIHVGLYEDETARLCHWHLPETHFLEAWSDARAFDGTASIVQPVIEPLHGGRSLHEVVALLIDGREVPGRDIVRDYWRRQWQQEKDAGEFETRWQTAVHDGAISGTRVEASNVSLAGDWQSHLSAPPNGHEANQPASGRDLELVFVPDPSLHDGRFANNGWLQELPKPITKLTWGNAAIMSPKTARDLGLEKGAYAHGGEHGGYHMPTVELKIADESVTAPVWAMPGHADGTVTVYLGNGRKFAGRVGGTPEESVGFNAYPLRTSKQLWFADSVQVTAKNETALVTCTQAHHSMEEREPVRTVSVDSLKPPPKSEKAKNAEPATSEPLTL
ncbi:MAG TPA: TAT-variant-translocated molybdopterin oxidoreductase, partial [Pirellulales bacterium]|nr:TAT-variant-translocated molybdopterin oxidoreductase [Pirellulales bacterium]